MERIIMIAPSQDLVKKLDKRSCGFSPDVIVPNLKYFYGSFGIQIGFVKL